MSYTRRRPPQAQSGWILLTVLLISSVALILFVIKNYALIRTLPILSPMFQRPARQFSSLPTTPTPTPTPIILHPGKGAYAVNQGDHAGPTVTLVTLDPLDVRKGQTLTLRAKFISHVPIRSARARIQTDGSPVTMSLTQKSAAGDIYEWEGVTTLPDTLWYRYIITVAAVSSEGENAVTVAPRGE